MKRKKFKLLISTLMLSILGGLFVGCSDNSSDNVSKISVSGSTSVGPLIEKLSEQYESKNSNILIEINQVGSSAGIKDTINEMSQIGMASRELKPEEKEQVVPRVIAYDGIALIVNNDNPIKGLTLEQVKEIYTGQITNWNQIQEGLDKPIVVISREDGSGTRSAFQEIVGYKSEQLVRNATIADGNGNIKATVEGNENAIGFVSFEYVDDKVSALTIDGVKPEANLVKEGKYAISRPFILATKKDTTDEETKKFIEYILSDDGQKIIIENKLIPVK